MSGSKIIILSKGEADTYLTADSNHSFFKSNNKTYSYFAQNWHVVSPGSDFKFDGATNTNIRLPLEGDLITKMLLRINVEGAGLDDATGKNYALQLIDTITFKYNDQVLSTLDYNYISMYHKLNCEHVEYKKFIDMVSVNTRSLENTFPGINQTTDGNFLYVPLPFWFTKNPGSAFPIWLLNNPRLTVDIKLRDTTKIQGLDLLIQYTNLLSKEKDVFKTSSLEYLIEQVDVVNKTDFVSQKSVKVELPKDKYVKYLLWNVLDTNVTNNLTSDSDVIEKTSILLNGNPVLNNAHKSITSLINRYNYFNVPYVTGFDFYNDDMTKYEKYTDKNDLNIHIQSFCLDPMKFQSSGFLTTDKFNNFTLEINTNGTAKSGTLHIYIIKHNILRIKDGVLNLQHN